jgi:protein-tyrosine phosphatase
LLTMRIEEIAMWVESGAYVQVTGQSLLGKFGKKAAEFARTLLDRRLVHFIASDGHDLKHRPPTMNEAHAWLVRNYGQPVADALCIDNPRSTLNGRAVNLPYMDAEISPQKKWYQIWR